MTDLNPTTVGRLGHRETTLLLAVTISARIFLGFPREMARIGGTASWLVVTFAFLVTLVAFILMDTLLARFPGEDLIGIAQKVAGPFSFLTGFIFFASYLAITAIVMRLFAETFVIGVLPRTPIGVLTGLLLALLILANYFGIETISRMAMLFTPYILLFVLLVFLLTIPSMRIPNLMPLWGTGFAKIAWKSWAKSLIFAEITLLGFIAPLLREESRRRKIGLSALLVSFLIMVTTVIVFTLVFDYPGTKHLIFPIYHLARQISIAEFFQRVEAIFVFLWFFTATIGLAAVFHGATYTFARTFSLPTHRPLLFPLGVLAYGLSLLPASFAEATRLDLEVLRVYALLPLYLLPPLLLALALLRRQKGGKAN
ncbi:MAG: GerAB/ArcD/ProY family transporter [Bacteroidota bacterium]